MSEPLKKTILIGTILISTFLRLWHLGSVPPSPSLDEVSIGYNAYSILATGRDEYGTVYPLLLRAYDDYRPALYVYLVVPFVWLLGLSVEAVRLPSVLLGCISVWAVYALVKEAGVAKKKKRPSWWREPLALIAAGLFALSPWHIYLSRLGHEANAGFSFFMAGGLFFFRKRYTLSSFFYALSFASYQSEKLLVPFMLAGLGLLFFNQLWNDKKKLIVPGLVFVTIAAPFLVSSLQPDALIRFRATNVIASEEPRLLKEFDIFTEKRTANDIPGMILHSRPVVVSSILVKQYTSHFDTHWLFSNNPDSPHPHKAPRSGLLYPWEAVSIALGLGMVAFLVVRPKRASDLGVERRVVLALLWWFLIAPIPAALTTGAPHAMRSYTMLPVWQAISAAGIIVLYAYIRNTALGQYKNIARYTYIIIIGWIASSSLIAFGQRYYIDFPKEQSDSFQYALARAVSYVDEHKQKYERIIFSNQDNLYQSYMFYLFHSAYDPSRYLAEGGTVSGGYDKEHYFDNFEFRPFNLQDEEPSDGTTLYIGNYDDLESDSPIYEIIHLSGEKAIYMAEK